MTDLDHEWKRCVGSVIYFAQEYARIFSSEEEQWISLDLWAFQIELLHTLTEERRILLLKARQLGFTTLVLVYLLWRFIFHPVASIGLFSRGELEAMELLDRFVKMYLELPEWMRAERVIADNAHFFEVSTGSWVRAMSTKKGESFTFKYLFWDELDRFENAAELIKNTKPAADASKAQIIAGSISDKDKPESVFKNMFRAAEDGENEWSDVFLPWHVRPGRDRAWYKAIMLDAVTRYGGDEAGAMDEVFQQYPSTSEEALSPRKQGKRIPFVHLQRVYIPEKSIHGVGEPAIPGLNVYRPPDTEFYNYVSGHDDDGNEIIKKRQKEYVIGADPAEGVEGGNDSAARILLKGTGEEVASFEGKFEPKKDFPLYLFMIAMWYNQAGIMVERNNHGHAVLGELVELIAQVKGCRVEILQDPNDNRVGWLTSPSGTGKTRGKAAMYATGAQYVKDMLCILHNKKTMYQLADIDIQTLKATGGADDCSDAFVLACVATTIPGSYIDGKVFY